MSTQAPYTPPDGGLQSGPTCPTCNAALASDQRYCLNCGQRLTDPRVEYRHALRLAPAPALLTGPAAGGRDPRNALVVLAGLATIVLAVGVGIVIGRGDGGSGTATKTTVVNVAGPTAAPAPAASAASGATTPTSAATVTDNWPAGASGWTVELSSLSSPTATQTDVTAAETAATAGGATAVGVLNGDDHSGTPTGKYVIYSGRFATQAQANAARSRLARKFPGALVLHVTPKRSASASVPSTRASAGASQAAAARKLSGSAYSKASAKLPNTIQTGGTPPPVDHKAAGGGTPATCIGC